MIYKFDSDVAMQVGVNGAIMLDNIAFWSKTNEANERHFHDGRYWTYNSIDAFQKLFPFWSVRTIRTTLEKLEKEDFIVSGFYSEDKMNRTKWYALSDKGKSFFERRRQKKSPSQQNGSMHLSKTTNASVGNDKTTIYTDIRHTDIKPVEAHENVRSGAEPAASSSSSRTRRPSHVSCPFMNPSPELVAAWCGFEEMRRSIRKPLTQRAADLIAKKVRELAPGDERKQAAILDQSVAGGWQGVYPLKTGEEKRGSKGYSHPQTVEEMYEEAQEILKNGGGIL